MDVCMTWNLGKGGKQVSLCCVKRELCWRRDHFNPIASLTPVTSFVVYSYSTRVLMPTFTTSHLPILSRTDMTETCSYQWYSGKGNDKRVRMAELGYDYLDRARPAESFVPDSSSTTLGRGSQTSVDRAEYIVHERKTSPQSQFLITTNPRNPCHLPSFRALNSPCVSSA